MIGGIFNIGTSALNAAQANISVTGNNIANVDTPGYCRQYVRQEEAYTLDGRPGGKGQGVNAAEVLRRFNKFLEKSYIEKSSVATRWSTQHEVLSSVESIFNESNRKGVSSSMTAFFKGWQDLALRPNDQSTRKSLIAYGEDVSLMLRQTTDNVKAIREQMDSAIADDVVEVNELIKIIADLNKQITMHTMPGVSNPNNLLDQRDLASRKLSEYMDVTILDRGGGDYSVLTKGGAPLVQGTETYEITLLGPRSESNKIPTSTYAGNIIYDGSDAYEYTVEMLTGGNVGDVPPPSFRASTDGGKTWLRDENGAEIHYAVTDLDNDGVIDPVQVKNLKISFSDANNFTAQDRFIVTPKTGIYWVEPTRGPQNITPQIYFDGTDNQSRLTGGSLSAYFNIRDDNCGRYLDQVNALANSMIWEVNRLHSQGSGLEHMTFANGTSTVYSANMPLGTAQSGLNTYTKITEGNIQFSIYDQATGAYKTGGPLNFGPGPAIQNFDPAINTLNDVANAINTTYAGQLRAVVLDGKLSIQSDPAANPPVSFSMGTDTTGLMAALGINTFFSGTDAHDITVNVDVRSNPSRVCAGAINGANEINPGDGATAISIGKLLTKAVTVTTMWQTTGDQSLSAYYSGIVAGVGADTRSAKTNAEYNGALAKDLDDRQSAIAGVNIDEEMAQLIKFQASYTAAAKLITTADQMLQTLLGLKQ